MNYVLPKSSVLRVDESVHEELKALAKMLDVPMNLLANEIVKNGISQIPGTAVLEPLPVDKNRYLKVMRELRGPCVPYLVHRYINIEQQGDAINRKQCALDMYRMMITGDIRLNENRKYEIVEPDLI